MTARATDILRRVPPHDAQAEIAVLGAVLLDNDTLDDILDIVEPADFYTERNRLVFESMVDLHLLGEPIDAVTLTDALRSREATVGAAYIAEIAGGVLMSANCRQYAMIVREKAVLRRLAATASEIASNAYLANGNARSVLLEAEAAMSEVFAQRDLVRDPEFPALVEQAASLLEHQEDVGIPTGYDGYDKLTGGLLPGELVLLAGMTSRGKTTWALNVALNLAKAGSGVLFVSCEMRAVELAGRYLFSEALIDKAEVRARGIFETEAQRVEAALELARTLPIAVRYRPGVRPREVVRLARQYRRQWKDNLRLVVVDYIGLTRPDRKGSTREIELDETAMALKVMAGDLGATFLVLAQLNREIHKREGAAPQLSDLRGSGAQEQHADTVCFIWSADTKFRPDGTDHQVQFTVAKSRNGPVGEFQLRHRPKFLRFENVLKQKEN